MKKALYIVLFAIHIGLYGQCNHLVWSDEFDGTALDQSKWAFQNGNGCPDLCGWGNGEMENYTSNSKNIKVANGLLTIEAVKENSNGSQFTSSKLRTLGLHSWTYGRFEARMRMPLGRGLWPAFWMLSDNNNWPMTGEIDIMEYRGDQPKRTSATVHYGSPWPNNQYDGNHYDHTQNLSDEFHLYAVEWEESEMRFYFDNVLIKKETKSPNSLNPPSSNNVWPWSSNFYLILNMAVGGGYTGNPTADQVELTKPTFEVDYVRVYTGLHGNTPTIAGPNRVFANTEYTYSLPKQVGVNYTWKATGGTIVSGNGTSEAKIKWEQPSKSQISVFLYHSQQSVCSGLSATVYKGVTAFNDSCPFIYNNFENRYASHLVSSSGTATEVANPNANAINGSSKVLKYVRNSGSAYDVIFLDSALVSKGSDFEKGQYAFELDIYTAKAAGTPIELQLASSAAWNDTWPIGRHSTYRATTTKPNQWETLRFTLDQVADPNRSQFDTKIDRLIVLLNPNSNTGDTYYIDNLKRIATNTNTCTLTDIEDVTKENIKIYPLPVTDVLWIESHEQGMVTLEIRDVKGVSWYQQSFHGNTQILLSSLPQGIYIVELNTATGKVIRKIVKS